MKISVIRQTDEIQELERKIQERLVQRNATDAEKTYQVRADSKVQDDTAVKKKPHQDSMRLQ